MKLTHHNTTPVLHRLLTGALALLWTVSAHAGDAPRSVTLPEATRIALDKNPGLAGAQQRVAAARAALRQADAAFWPQIRLSANYAASDNPVQAFMMTLNQRAFTFAGDFNDPDTTDNLNGKVLATYSLFNGGHDWAGRQAARLGADANAQLLEAARRDLVFEVTRAFHTVGKARRFVRVAETGLASMAENLNVASNRFAQGVALKSDWLDAEVRLAEAREELLRSRNALAIAEAIFRNTLGVGESETMTPAEPGADTPADALTDPAGIAPRPELVAAQKAVAAAERQVRAAFGRHLPRVHAFASYDIDSGDAQHFEESWLAGVSVEVDVFDGFLTRGKIAEARAQLAAARAQLRQTELAVQLEMKQALLNLDEARARLETTARAAAQAEESLHIAQQRYAEGLTLLAQVLDAETARTRARQRRVAAEADALIARAALDKALGRPWRE